MKTNAGYKSFLSIASLLIIQLCLLYYIKYSNQGLALSEFSLAFIGNIFNLIVILAAILGLFILLIVKNQSNYKRKSYVFILLLYIVLICSFVSTKISLPFGDIYFLRQSGDKFFVASLFTFYHFVLFIFLSIIWLAVFGEKKFSLIKSSINGVIMLLVFLVLSYFYITLKGYDSGSWILSKNKSNIAVVLGAAVWSGNLPSPTLSGRIDRVLELLDEGYAGKILLTGSNAPGELSEASVALQYAVSKGVDTSMVIMEQGTTSTNEQIKYIKENLAAKGGINEIIVISDSYHLPRVLEIGDFYNIDLKVASSGHILDFKSKLYNNVRESIALIVFWSFAL